MTVTFLHATKDLELRVEIGDVLRHQLGTTPLLSSIITVTFQHHFPYLRTP
jgi:hypothetical protein